MPLKTLRFRAVRRAGLVALTLGIAALSVRYLAQGLVLPIRIGSGSMAPTLLGPHFRHTCHDCRFLWKFDAVQPTDFARLVCPNCGAVNKLTESPPRQRGERVLINRWSYLFHAPRRGDVVVYHRPQAADQLAVKRIVGLPGEQITLHEGDVYVDGEIVRKPLAELREIAVLVHNTRYKPREKLPPRWAPEPEVSAAGRAWISFRAWRCFDSPLPRTSETRVLDNDGYNQGLSRETAEVYDLLLCCRVRQEHPGVVAFRGHNGRAEYRVEVNARRERVMLRRGEQPLVEALLPPAATGPERLYEFALFDRQVVFAIDGQELLVYHEDDLDDLPRRAVLRPLAYATSARTFEVTDLRVYRDLHYLPPRPGGMTWHRPAQSPNAYFLLGDNVPLSIDSRHEPQAVTRKHLLGKALRLP